MGLHIRLNVDVDQVDLERKAFRELATTARLWLST